MERNELPAAEWVAVSALRPWSGNPRQNDAAVDKVADSIKRFGFGAPILARKADGEIIAGHTRLKAARKIGLERVPVRFLDLDPADAHLLALADNKLGEIAEWDDDRLNDALAELRGQGLDLDLANFGEEGLKIDPPLPLTLEDFDVTPKPRPVWILIETDEVTAAEIGHRIAEAGLKVRMEQSLKS